MRRLSWLAVLALVSAPLAAEPPRPAWEGVWQGTVGNLAVRACFAQHGDSWATGSYYYLSKLKPIALEKGDAAGRWNEGEGEYKTGAWSIANSGADRLTGEWRSGAKALPITLMRVASGPAEGGACGSEEYLAPRVRPVRVVSSPASSSGIAYSKLTYQLGPAFEDFSIASFAIREQQPGDRAINAALRVDPMKFEGEADYLGCERQALSMHGSSGAFSFEAVPDLMTANYLSVTISTGGDCGGAHPDDGSFHRTFDRQTGKRVDLGKWFTARAVHPRLPDDTDVLVQITPALRTLLLRHMRFEQAECREAIASEEFWDVGLTRTGFVFTPSLPHVVQACEGPASVAFAAIDAWLSPAGKQGVARVK